jgi:hypothetical protein
MDFLNSLEFKRQFKINFKNLISEKNIDGIRDIIDEEDFKNKKELISKNLMSEANALIEKSNEAINKLEKCLVKQNLIDINKALLSTRDLEPKYCNLLQKSIDKANFCLTSLQMKEKFLDDMREIVEAPFDIENYEKLKNLRKEAYEKVGMYMFPKNTQERNILKFTEDLLIKFEKKKDDNKMLLSTLESLIALDDLQTLESFLKANRNDLPKTKYNEGMSIIALHEEIKKKEAYEKYMKEQAELLKLQKIKEEEEQKEKKLKEEEEYQKKLKDLEQVKKANERNIEKTKDTKKLEEYKKSVLSNIHQDLLELSVDHDDDLHTPLSSSPGGKFDLFVSPQKKDVPPPSSMVELKEETPIDPDSKTLEIKTSDTTSTEFHTYKIKIKEPESIPNICKDFHQSVLHILRYMELEKDPVNVVVQNIDPYSEFVEVICKSLSTLLLDSRKSGIFQMKTSIFEIARKYDSKIMVDFKSTKAMNSGKRSLMEEYELFIRFLLHSGRACHIYRSLIQDTKYARSVYEDASFIRNEEYRDQLLLTFDLMEHVRFSFMLFVDSLQIPMMIPATPLTPISSQKNDLVSTPLDSEKSTSSLNLTSNSNSGSNNNVDELLPNEVDPIIIKSKKKKKKTIQTLQ